MSICGGIPTLAFAYINGKIKFSNHGKTPSEKQKRTVFRWLAFLLGSFMGCFLFPTYNFTKTYPNGSHWYSVYLWPTFAFTGESGYTLGFRRRIAHNGLHGETGGHPCVVARSIWLRPHHLKNSRRKRLHAYGVCPLSPAPQPRWAVGTYSFVTAWSFLHRYQSGQQREFSIKTIRRPNVHCKTECILLQYSEKSLEWRRYMICPLSSFETTSRK